MTRQTTASRSSAQETDTTALPTFMDHVRELQGRIFTVAIVFIVFAAAAYPFFDKIANFLLAPLGKDNELVYLTPGGAFAFIIQVCMYVGFVASLPVLIYHIYRFVMPVIKQTTLRKALIYTVASFVLALVGMLFAYYVSLPAALYFLTGFDLYHISPMLTIDSYFSFIMTYMLVGAILFQIPLIMLIINGATPLKPKNLMKHQGKIILGSFIVAALVSPTPDAMNQTLLASPMVVMYQLGIMSVWSVNRRSISQRRRYTKGHKKAMQAIDTDHTVVAELVEHLPPVQSKPATSFEVRPVGLDNTPTPTVVTIKPKLKQGSMDGLISASHFKHISPPPRTLRTRPALPHLQRQLVVAARPADGSDGRQPNSMTTRSIDGFSLL